MEVTSVFEADELIEQIAALKEKIKAAEAERDAFIEIYQAKMAAASDLCEEKTCADKREMAVLEEALRSFAAKNLPEGKKSIRLPSGKLSFKKQPPKFFFEDMTEVAGTDERLIKICKEIAPSLIKVKTVETADWSELKKKLLIDGGKIFFDETGEVIENLIVQVPPEKFTVATF